MKKTFSIIIAIAIIITVTPLAYASESRVYVDLSNQNINDEKLAEMVASGEIPRNVFHLVLFANQINDLTPLSGLANLHYLELDNNQISDLTPLEELTNLKGLGLNGNQINDLTPLSGLTNLNYLDINKNQIKDLTPLSELMNLIRIQIDENPISGEQITELFEILGLDENGSRPPLTTSDALLVLRAVAGLAELTDAQIARLGIDGEPTTNDAMRILRTVAGITN